MDKRIKNGYVWCICVPHTISLWKYFVTLFRNLDRISPQLIFLLIRQVYLSVDLSSFGLKVQDVCWAGDLIRNVL